MHLSLPRFAPGLPGAAASRRSARQATAAAAVACMLATLAPWVSASAGSSITVTVNASLTLSGTAALQPVPAGSTPSLSSALSSGPGNLLAAVACPVAAQIPTSIPGTNQLSSVVCALSTLSYAFVTTYTKPLGGTLRKVHRATVGVPTFLEVTGDLLPDFVGTLGVSTNLDGIALRITRLAIPATAPVDIQAVLRNPATPDGFVGAGYDGAAGTPADWTASLSLISLLADDGAIDAQIRTSMPPPRLGVRAEVFSGNPDAPSLVDRGVVGFAPVPATIDAQMRIRKGHARIGLATTSAAVVTPLVQQISGTEEQRLGGTITSLPRKADLTYDKVDRLATIAYSASEPVGSATLTSTELLGGVAQKSTETSLTGVPTSARISYRTAPPGTLPATTDVTYSANARATTAALKVTEPGTTTAAKVSSLPTALALRHTKTATGGEVSYTANTPTPRFELATSAATNAARLDLAVDQVPAEIEFLRYDTVKDTSVRVEHRASDRIPRLTLRTAETSPNAGIGRRVVDTTIEGIPTATRFTLDTSTANTQYVELENSGPTDRVTVSVVGEKPLFARATKAELTVRDLPASLAATIRSATALVDGVVLVDAHGGTIGSIDLLASSGPDTRLPADEDGVYLRDLDGGDYVMSGRIRGLRRLLYAPDKEGVAERLELDAVAPQGTDLVVDSWTNSDHAIWTGPMSTRGPSATQFRRGLDRVQLRLADYPAKIFLTSSTTPAGTRTQYQAAARGGDLTLTKYTKYSPTQAPVSVHYATLWAADRLPSSYPVQNFDSDYSLSLSPMPASFEACLVPVGPSCSRDTWKRSMFEDWDPDTEANGGSLGIYSSERTHLVLNESKAKSVEIAFTRPPDGCQFPGVVVEIPFLDDYANVCRHTDAKPGRATQRIDLSLNRLVIQNDLGSSAWVGQNIAAPIEGAAATKQGYVAMDSGWRDPIGHPAELPYAWEAPTGDGRIIGQIDKGGSMCMASEDCDALYESFKARTQNAFLGVAARLDPAFFQFTEPTGFSYRVFEFDPDELINAKHKSGVAYCGDESAFIASGANFTGHMCGIRYLP